MPYKAKKLVLPWNNQKPSPRTTHGNWGNTNFYHSKEWRQLRAEKKEMNPYCEECYEQKGKQIKMYYVDHIIAIIDGGLKCCRSN